MKQTQYPSIKLPDQKDNQYYPSTPSQQDKYIKTLSDQQGTELTTTGRIGVDAVRQGIVTPVDPAYYDMDATTGPGGLITPKKDSLIFGITTPPPPSTDHPIVRDVKTKMITKKQGYFTAFVQQLCAIIAVKNPLQSKELYIALEQVLTNMIHRQGRLVQLGTRFETTVMSMSGTLKDLEPDVIQGYASIVVSLIEEKETALAADVQSLLHDIDDIYSFQEGEELLNTLVQVDEYPKNDSAVVVVQSVMEKVFRPYFRIAGSQTRDSLIQSINNVVVKRDYRKKNNGDSGFDEDFRYQNDKHSKVARSFKAIKLNSKERSDVIVKELIENVKVMEKIKKYETKIFPTTEKTWLNFYKRANIDEYQSKNTNSANRKTIKINFDGKKDKMGNLDDGVMKYKLKTKRNFKFQTNKESRNIIDSELAIYTDRNSGSISQSKSVSKTYRYKMEKHTKPKKKNYFIRKHGKMSESLKKRREKNESKNNEPKRFDVVKRHRKKPSFDDKTLAKDDYKRYSIKENRRLSDNRRHYGSRRRPPGANTQTSMYLTPRYKYNSRRFNENLNLTRRSNAKPISTELSYSYEEKDIKFHIQDAIRHPIDLKSKIQQNSLIFDKIQNIRRQMAPLDRIRLKDESSFSDDQGIIKNNIYKVFNKNMNY